MRDDDVVAFYVGRLRHAQPVCPPASPRSAGRDVDPRAAVADTCSYYPEDRGISESIASAG